jgi:hypothetical protein
MAIYFPVILGDFAMCNDYALLHPDKSQGFSETNILISHMRPLGALLVNVCFWTIHSMRDIIVWRAISFLTMGLTFFVFFQYMIRRWNIPFQWAGLCIFMCGLLPPSTLFVSWVCHWAPGFVTVLLSMVGYILWDSPRWFLIAKSNLWKRLVRILGGLFCLLAFFIFPPNAMMAVVFSFLHMFLTKSETIKETRKIVCQDLIFLGSVIFVYAALIKTLRPLVNSITGSLVLNTRYQMDIGFPLREKLSLIAETLQVSLGGIWYFKLIDYAFLVWVFMFLSLMVMWVASKEPKKVIFEKLGWWVFMFFIVNLPSFLAGGCTYLIGYRMIFPSMLIVWCPTILGLMFAFKEKRNIWGAVFICGIIFWAGLIVSQYMKEIRTQYNQEKMSIKNQLDKCPIHANTYILFKEPDKNFGRYFPWEYKYQISTTPMLLPFVIERLDHIGSPPGNFSVDVLPVDQLDGAVSSDKCILKY